MTGGVLGDLLGTLTDAPLIQLKGVSLSAVAKAADTLGNSSATTSANFGHLMVGGKDLGVLDLNATVAQVTALKGSVLGLVNGITSTLGLGNLIDIGILERTSSVKAENGYNVASSGLDLLRVSINPPAALSGIISGIGGTSALSGLLSGLQLPALPVVGGLPLGGLPLGSDVLGQAFGLTSLLSAADHDQGRVHRGQRRLHAGVAGETLTRRPG